MSPDLALALSFADAADAISLGRFRASDLLVETKPDRTPVTEADRAVEEAIRERLAVERPDDGMLGEEFGVTGGGSRRWIVDPIDGTRNYSRGIPIWATLIALEVDGAIQLGVVSAPALGRRWWAERGAGAFVERRSDPRLPRRRGRGRRPLLRARAAAAGDRPPLLAPACVRRLLGAHARRRGCRRRRDRRDRRQGLGSRRAAADRRGGRWALQRPRTASRGSTASRRSRRTACCTRRCSRHRAASR